MSDTPKDLKFTKTHEWVRVEEDGVVTVGISDHAQQLLGDMVFVEMPETELEFGVGDECGVLESVKAASDLYAPLSGVVVGVNDALGDEPSLVNSDPYGEGWLFQLQPNQNAELENLLDSEAYSALLEEEA